MFWKFLCKHKQNELIDYAHLFIAIRRIDELHAGLQLNEVTTVASRWHNLKCLKMTRHLAKF